MSIFPLESGRLSQAKAAFTTRRVDIEAISTVLTGALAPKSGDLVLARVDEISQHQRIDLAIGRKAHLFPRDEIVVCYGNRYAPDQFEAEIPSALTPCHLVASGGLAARVLSQHVKMEPATTLTPSGLLGDCQGRRINIADWALEPTTYIGQRPLTIAVVGASMNSGKTTTAAHLIKGLVQAGLKVGAAKLTGTGAVGDIWLMQDAGANPVLDFTDTGFPSTYRAAAHDIQSIFTILTSHLATESVDVIVLEIADGLYQDETSRLVSSLTFRNRVDGVLFATPSALGAYAGKEWLQRYQIPVLGISGVVTMSPLAARETATATGLPVLDLEMLRAEAANLISTPTTSMRAESVPQLSV